MSYFRSAQGRFILSYLSFYLREPAGERFLVVFWNCGGNGMKSPPLRGGGGEEVQIFLMILGRLSLCRC